MQYNRWMKVLGLALILTLVIPLSAAFAQDGGEAEPIVLPEVDPLSVTGDIAIAGSSTVEPITVAMAARLNDDGFSGNITVAETGTGAGFERFCVEGSTDINNASRPVKDSELDSCAAIGRENVLEFRVGTDAITIVVNKENDFVTELKRSDLIKIFTGEVKAWNEINPEWPAEAIQLYTPGTDSGTFTFFGEAVLGTKGIYAEEEARTDALLAAEPTVSENDNTLVEGVLGSPYAIGYFGFAYYLANQDNLTAIAVANDISYDEAEALVVVPEEEWAAAEKPIEYIIPDEETAEAGTYMLSRPLFIYSDASILAEKPQVAAYINYYLTNANEVVTEVGYFPVSVEVLNASNQAWLDAMGVEAVQ